jgi:hypothetical protein
MRKRPFMSRFVSGGRRLGGFWVTRKQQTGYVNSDRVSTNFVAVAAVAEKESGMAAAAGF